MKIATQSVVQPQTSQPGYAPVSNGGTPAAFSQTLRSLEKEMWPAAAAGRMDTMKLPTRGSGSHNGEACAKTDAFSAPAETTSVSGRALQPYEGAASTGASKWLDSTTTASVAVAFRVPDSTLAGHVPSVHPLAPAPAAEDTTPVGAAPSERTSARAATPTEQSAPDATAPFRVSLLAGAQGPTVALRLNSLAGTGTTALSQRVYAELRRQGIHAARVVINGVAAHPIHLQGEPHGD
ncbi:hypothetical protein FAZ69_11020 [Trinickia terrae]|uniref:Uncharacterized protein n=1 Tax=Trinickia terrae TaxID=2571161 RepID=A0A4U1I876_9BURK|nr:hypothetical protein [Trinickia terrae]TKC89455.1 hypothetical protein FAZ69_11020 [Trinickia terrae]